jgi:hypothetical protein
MTTRGLRRSTSAAAVVGPGLVAGCGCMAYLMPTTIESGPESGSA